MDLAGCDVSVWSYLKDFGYTEDGESFIGEVYCVYVTDAEGNRWVHGKEFPGVEKWENEWAVGFKDVREEALAQCNALAAKVLEAGTVNLDYWCTTRPAYGSYAYEAYGRHDDMAWEKEVG